MEPDFRVTQKFIESRPLSASSLKAFRKSPRHYLMYLEKEYKPAEAMILGSVVDVLALTPKQFEKRFVALQKPNLNTKIGRTKWLEMKEKAIGDKLTVITAEQLSTAKKMVDSLYSNSESARLLNNKKNAQRKLLWRNKKYNIPLIGYLDFETELGGEPFVVDLKTTNDASPDKFIRDAASFDYEIQVATYLDYFHRKKFSFPSFIFLTVENKEPFNVSVFYCPPDYIERAKNEFYGTLAAFRYCLNNFPDFNVGYEFRLMGTNDFFLMDIPKYKKETYYGFDEKKD